MSKLSEPLLPLCVSMYVGEFVSVCVHYNFLLKILHYFCSSMFYFHALCRLFLLLELLLLLFLRTAIVHGEFAGSWFI